MIGRRGDFGHFRVFVNALEYDSKFEQSCEPNLSLQRGFLSPTALRRFHGKHVAVSAQRCRNVWDF